MQAQSEVAIGTKIKVEASAEVAEGATVEVEALAEVPEEIKTIELTETNDNKGETVTMAESELQLEVEKGMDSMKTLLEKREQNLRLREKNSIFIHDAEERVAEIEKILQSLLEKLFKLRDGIVTCINENAEFERQDACLTVSIAVLENKISELQKEIEKRNRLVFLLYSWNEQGTIEKLDEYPQYADLEDSEQIYKIQESDRLAQMAKVIELEPGVREELFKNPQILKNIATILRVQEIVGERLVIILEEQNNDKEKFIAKILKLFGISIEILN